MKILKSSAKRYFSENKERQSCAEMRAVENSFKTYREGGMSELSTTRYESTKNSTVMKHGRSLPR